MRSKPRQSLDAFFSFPILRKAGLVFFFSPSGHAPAASHARALYHRPPRCERRPSQARPPQEDQSSSVFLEAHFISFSLSSVKPKLFSPTTSGYGGGDGGAPGGGGGEQEVIRVARRVYVSNLTYRLSWQELKDFAREAGNVVHAKVMESGGRSKGCGIVEYSTAEEAAQAILTLHDRMLGGRPVCVREDREDRDLRGALEGEGGGGRVGGGGGYRGVSVRSRSRSPPRGDRYARADRPPPVRTEASPCTLYVGNLAYTSTWQSLKDHAASLGIAGVARAEVPANAGGRSRGFGLITFETPSEAEAAVAQLNETELDGRRLLVRLDRGSVRT